METGFLDPVFCRLTNLCPSLLLSKDRLTFALPVNGKPAKSIIFTLSFLLCDPGPAPGWHLEHIDVKDEIMDKTFRFPCDRWLSKNDDDGQIMRELACANNDYLDLNEKTSKATLQHQ